MDKVILKIVIFTIALLLKDVSSNRCTSQQTCGKCISRSSQCAWCSQENFGDNGSPRCDYVRKLLKNDCDPAYIHEPVHHLSIVENREFGHYWETNDVHIKPQEIKITLTPNSVRKFWVDFRQIQDNPLDLYFLIDLSTTNKQMMIQLGNELAEELPKITSYFRIGFGTFVQKQRESCLGCAPSLAFQNVMMLSSDTNRFAQKIEDAADSVNLNAPYRGLDVILKAIACKDEIGWRKNSRKILLYASDNYYNYPVNEQLEKTIAPNDKFCHLDSNGYFSNGTECGCTSVSQIDHHIRKSKVRIIFAVTRRKRTLYLKLSRNLSDSSIATLDGDLSKIIDLVREQYDNIRSTVELKDNLSKGSSIKLTYYSKCRGSKLEKTNYCKGLKKGTDVTFEIEMESASCPSERKKRNGPFSIYTVGVRARLIVNLEIQCECDCEKPGINEINSPKCNESGTFECGTCTCNNNKYGDKCECAALDADIPLDPYMGCKENANDTLLCSGRGECVCGVCNCFPRQNPDEIVFGRVCQCDNFLCDTHNGVMCSGPDQGRCDCGKCVCHTGWKGSDCSCRESDIYCFYEK